MKKLIFIFAILVIFFLFIKQPGATFFEGFEEDDDFSIFSDPNFSQPTNQFSPGQMIYLKVESFVEGVREKTLRLLDAEKREIQRFNLNQSGNIFTLSFAAPDTPGIYYLDIKIRDSQGSVYASQENITVGEVSGQSVSSEAIAESIVGEETQLTPTLTPMLTPTPTLEVEEKALPEIQKNFFSQIFEKLITFLRKIFRFGP